MVIKELSLAALCLSLAGCYRGTWDFPYPKPGVKEISLEEKASDVADYLGKKESYIYLYSGNLLVEIFKDKDNNLETSVTHISDEHQTATEMTPSRMVFWADRLPYGSPDVALVENNTNVKEINPQTTCVLDMQEMAIDAVYEKINGRDHLLRPNQSFYRYFNLCFNELTNF